MIGTAALIGAGAVGLLSNYLAGRERSKGLAEKNEYYDYADDVLQTQFYRDPTKAVGNASIIKQSKKNYADNLDAINNRAIAGGATMENQLAARQANNENFDSLQLKLLQNEDARRDNILNQRLSLQGQKATENANAHYQRAQDWSAWGSAAAQSILGLGQTSLLDAGKLGGLGSTFNSGEMVSQLKDAVYPYNQALVAPTGLKTPSLVTTSLGGLKK